MRFYYSAYATFIAARLVNFHLFIVGCRSAGSETPSLADKDLPAAKSIEPVGDGFLAVTPDAFPNDFAADTPEPVAHFIAISQVPASSDALKAKATVAAWKTKAELRSNSQQSRMNNPTSSDS